MLARVIQHEFDHLFGVLFTDHLGSFRKRMVRRSLRKIANGEVEADYPLVTAEGERV
jgi:peptide deformylase